MPPLTHNQIVEIFASFDDAQQAGNGRAKAARAARFHLKAFEEIKLSTAPNSLVKGILPRDGLAVIWGPPKCGKSFWCFDLTMHVALGREYRGCRVQQGTVVYLALEGGGGFAARVEAWRRRHLNGQQGQVPFFLLDVPVDLVADCNRLIAAIAEQLENLPAVIVIDTLNRALVGDENKSDDMAKLIRAADALRVAFGCLVVLVHHCGVAGNRPRGHSSLAGADDVLIAIERDGAGKVIVKIDHMKDGEAAGPMASRLERMELGTDDDGEPITSCVVVPTEGEQPSASISASFRLNGNQRRFLDILRDAATDAPSEHKTTSDIPGGRTAVTREWLKTCCKAKGWFDAEATDNNNRARLSNMLNALAGRHLIGLTSLYVWIAE